MIAKIQLLSYCHREDQLSSVNQVTKVDYNMRLNIQCSADPILENAWKSSFLAIILEVRIFQIRPLSMTAAIYNTSLLVRWFFCLAHVKVVYLTPMRHSLKVGIFRDIHWNDASQSKHLRWVRWINKQMANKKKK